MDVNEYMSKSLALLERIAEGVEAINESGVFIANQNDLENAIPVVVLGGGVSNLTVALPEGTDLKAVGGLVHAQPAKQATAEEEKPKPAAEPAKQDVKPAPAAEPKQDAKAKKVTVDDARAALKKYASTEGNDAAMELLTSLGASSVSSLAEQGPGKLQELIDRCEGKGK